MLPALFLLGGCGSGDGAGGGRASAIRQNLPAQSEAGRSATGYSSYSAMQRVSKLILKSGENSLYTGVIDPAKGYAYFGTSASVHPGYIVKVALNAGNAAPTEVASLPIPTGQEGIICSVIDTVHGYAYFGNANNPAQILKVALGTGAAAPRLVGTLKLNSGESALLGAAIDVTNGYAYFGSADNPGVVVKVALGQGDALPTRVGAVRLPEAAGRIRRVLIDEAKGYVYAVAGDNMPSAMFAKIAVGAGNAAPTLVGVTTFPAGEDHFNFASLDPATGYAYLGTYDPCGKCDSTTPGKIVKVRLNAGNAAPTRIGSITVPPKYLTSGAIDPNTHAIYIGNDETFPASNALQVDPGQGDALPTLVNTIQLVPGTTPYTFATRPIYANATMAGEIYIQSGVIDPIAGYIYYGTDTLPGQIIKIAIPATYQSGTSNSR
jgi:hypothetical protein